MPTYQIRHADGRLEHLEADDLHHDGQHLVLRGTAYVMNRPRTIVLRRIRPQDATVEIMD